MQISFLFFKSIISLEVGLSAGLIVNLIDHEHLDTGSLIKKDTLFIQKHTHKTDAKMSKKNPHDP